MRKQVFGRKFKRDKNERKALFSGLISSMILKGRIETTEEKAKAIRGDLEKMVTKAKKGESSKRLLYKDLTSFEVEKMINQIGPSFANRAGGYTRIIKTGKRFNDNAGMAIMEWTEKIKEIPALPAGRSNLKSQKLDENKNEKKNKSSVKSSRKESRRAGSKTKRKETPSSRKATKGKASK